MGRWSILRGDSLQLLSGLDDSSVDSLVCDPPAGISFMGKEWDHDHGGRAGWVAAFAAIFRECMRVMKPGAHGLVWALPRTSHWTICALEDAGFEVRDVVVHLQSQGFPKSMDISKAIDERPGSTQETKRWAGWGTALKPSSEFWVLIRKPLGEKTVAANVLKHGVGGINIDGCRVEVDGCRPKIVSHANASVAAFGDGLNGSYADGFTQQGRFPANMVLSHDPECRTEGDDAECREGCPVAELDRQSGELAPSFRTSPVRRNKHDYAVTVMHERGTVVDASQIPQDAGGASRFFYQAKAAPREKWFFCRVCNDAFQIKRRPDHQHDQPDTSHLVQHPTPKGLGLMRYLCRLITPPDGLILDPFMGTGSTGVAALQEGFRFIGMEREASYLWIAKRRLQTEDREGV